jgi:nanoRNase/pAp phosphatase (c-di-AMP/oligoRNAs hydrolase)
MNLTIVSYLFLIRQGLNQTKKKKATEAKITETKASLKHVNITDTVEKEVRKEQHERDQKWKKTGRDQIKSNTNFDMARSLFGGGGHAPSGGAAAHEEEEVEHEVEEEEEASAGHAGSVEESYEEEEVVEEEEEEEELYEEEEE